MLHFSKMAIFCKFSPERAIFGVFEPPLKYF